MFFDPRYLIFALPALLFGLWAQSRVQSAFRKYSRIGTYAGASGGQIARRMLDMHGLSNVRVEEVNGFLSDHYDPRTRVLRLSPDVYRGRSIASAGIAAHEAGHAIQHQQAYLPLKARSAMVPTVQIGSWLGPVIFFIGMFTAQIFGTGLAWAGLFLFGATALFALVTLPVEFDASKRAKAWLSTSGVVMNQEMQGVSSVLDAAALTYVAAAAQAVSTLLYYGMLLSGMSRRD